ncbi:MAG: hypothetical protein V4693_16650 [Pseudomonadota bacterium]
MNKPHPVETPTAAAIAVVVEEARDAHILRTLLTELPLRAPRFFAGQGRMSVISLARNILIQEPTSVVLAYDAKGEEVNRLQRELSSLLELVSSPARFRVVVFNPSLDEVVGGVVHGQNDAIPEKMKAELRRHPQIENFLHSLRQLQSASEEEVQPGAPRARAG